MANLFGAPMQNPVLQQQAQDPRQLLAQSLIAGGANARPVNTPIEGIARLGSALAGALIARNVGREYKQRGENYNQTLAQALQASQPWKAPDNIMSEDNSRVVVPQGQNAPGTGGMEALAAALRGNPDTAPMAMQMQFDQFGRQNALQDAIALERGKSEFAPPVVLPEGGTAINRAGSVVAQGGPRQTDRQREAVGMGLQPGTQEYNDFIRSSRQPASTNVSVSTGESLTPAQKVVDEKWGADYAKWGPGGGFADSQRLSTQLRTVVEALAANPALTGPKVGLQPRSVLALTNPKALDALESVEDVVQRNLREVLGAQFTEKEGERLISRAYNPNLPGDVNAARLSRLLGAMEKAAAAKQKAAEYFEANGTLRGFKGSLMTRGDIEDAIGGDDAPGTAAPPPLKGNNPYADKSDDDILKDLKARGYLK